MTTVLDRYDPVFAPEIDREGLTPARYLRLARVRIARIAAGRRARRSEAARLSALMRLDLFVLRDIGLERDFRLRAPFDRWPLD